MKYLKINESLKEIEIPYSIYIISKKIFFNHQEIKKLKKKIPESVIDIHYSSFKKCNKLTIINIPFRLKTKFEIN